MYGDVHDASERRIPMERPKKGGCRCERTKAEQDQENLEKTMRC